MKKWWFIIVALILLVGFANAFSKEKSLEWLNNTISYQSASIEESAFTLLALKSNNFIRDTNYLGYIIFQQRKDDAGCYPRGACNAKDTALGALTNFNFNTNYNDLLTWLDTTISKANVEDWYIQIHTPASGRCTVVYDEDQEKEVIVDGTNKLKIDGQSVDWINVKTNLGINLDQPIEEIIVDCTNPSPGVNDQGMLISLLRITNNEFYIYQESQGRIADLKINNACYADTSGGSCSKEASFYSAWVLKRLGREVKVIPYLQKNAVNNKDYAMLLSITGDQSYAQLLAESQYTRGYWDSQNIITTAFAINALRSFSTYTNEAEKAKKWLEGKQNTVDPQNNGSYGNIINTATAIYIGLTDVGFPIGPGSICGNNITETGEQCDDGNLISGDDCSSICRLEGGGGGGGGGACVFNSDCGVNELCDNGVCIDRCTTDADCPVSTPICNTITGRCQSSVSQCDNDGICESGETIITCPSDCGTQAECTIDSDCAVGEVCEQGQCELASLGCTSDSDCDNGEECDLDTNQCVEKEGLSILFWVSLVIIIAILAVGGYFAYNKFFKKPKSGEPSFLQKQPRQPPRTPIQISRPSYKRSKTDEILERELDKSIKEAERLLKK
mgnify:CR=1 FL=1